jgi:predicted permease
MATKRIIRREKTKVKSRVIYGIVGLIVWTILSFAFLDIAIERFENKEDLLNLGLSIAGIILGYVIVLYTLGVRRKKKEDER